MQPLLPEVDSMLYVINTGQDVSVNMRGVIEIAKEVSFFIFSLRIWFYLRYFDSLIINGKPEGEENLKVSLLV